MAKRTKNMCGAMTHKGTPCRNPAGFKTPHLGEGRCYQHGGLTPARTMHVQDSNLYQKAMEYAKDPGIFNMSFELGLLKAMLEEELQSYEQDKTKENLYAIKAVIDSITRTTDKFFQIVYQHHFAVTIPQLEDIIRRIVEILNTTIDDPQLKEAIAMRLRDELVLPETYESLALPSKR
jgi:hypothetical protein